MRGTVAAISRALGAPFVSKNVMHSVQVGLLDAVFPGAVFIEVAPEPRRHGPLDRPRA